MSAAFGHQLRQRLEQMILNLGGTLPPMPSSFDEENRYLQLLDALANALDQGAAMTLSFALQVSDIPCYFFIADRPCSIKRVSLIYPAASTTSASLEMAKKLDGHSLSGGGQQVFAFNLAAAANTVYLPALDPSASLLNANDRLSLHFLSTPETFHRFTITVHLMPRFS